MASFLESGSEYLRQYSATYVPVLSDDSDRDSKDYPIEEPTAPSNIEEMQREKKRKLLELEENRKNYFEEYLNEEKDEENSIFNLDGIKFNCFNYKYISFSFAPKKLHVKYFKKELKYRISLKYRSYGWCLKRMKAPRKQALLDIFWRRYVEDEDLEDVLFKIYNVLKRGAKDYVTVKKQKWKRYLKNPSEVQLYSDEEEIFLSAEELEMRRKKTAEIWQRMLPPPK